MGANYKKEKVLRSTQKIGVVTAMHFSKTYSSVQKYAK